MAELDAKIIDCMAQGKSGYIPIAQTIGTTRDTVEHRMKAMLTDGRLVKRRDADGCMMPRLPLPTSPAPAPAPTAPAKPVMPEGLTLEGKILWAVTGGQHSRIASAIGESVVEVARMLDSMRDRYLLDSLVVEGYVNYYLPGTKPAAVPQEPAKTAPELTAAPVAAPEPAAAPSIPGHVTHVTENDEPEPASAPKEIMPKDLTFDEVIYWQIEHGEDRPFYIAEAARDHQGRVTQRMFHLAEVGKLLMRNERGMTRYDVVRVIPAATTADTACTA